MAKFVDAYVKTIRNEGGYKLTHNPNDTGKLTFAGVSRVHNEFWNGWEIVDRIIRDNPDLEYSMLDFSGEVTLKKRVASLYRQKYWDAIKADHILDQRIAETMFDFAINAGSHTSAVLAQTTVGVNPDGRIGKKSLAALNKVSFDGFNLIFGYAKLARYAEICNKNPAQIPNLLGWLNRTLKVVARDHK